VKISGQILALTAYVNTNNDVLWRCGTSTAPSAGSLASGVSLTTSTILPQYVPTSCHS